MAIVLLFILALVAGCSGGSVDAANVIGVKALAADPQAYTGQIAVKGVVQNIDTGSSVVSIIDETEFASCGLTPCSSAGIIPLVLPTSGKAAPSGAFYKGDLPQLEDVIVVIGEIKSSPQGAYFDVVRVERGSDTLIEKVR